MIRLTKVHPHTESAIRIYLSLIAIKTVDFSYS